LFPNNVSSVCCPVACFQEFLCLGDILYQMMQVVCKFGDCLAEESLLKRSR
jgi:hypothetical protein